MDYQDVYFANKPKDDAAAILLDRAASFYQTLNSNAYLDKLCRMWEFYHGHYNSGFGTGHSISFTGEQGELTQLPINHFRNIAEHIITMITSNRITMEARSVNTDYKSMSQTYLANGILDYYMRQKNLEKFIYNAVRMAVVLGSGFIKIEWNATEGEEYDFDEETGKFNYNGDIEFSNLSPFDVVVDGTKESWNNEWILTRSFQNKYNLMAKYPEFKDKILTIQDKNTRSNYYRMVIFSNDQTDDIPVYEFFHKKTEACPQGRYMLFLARDIVLLDIPMPYKEIPVFRLVPGEYIGTPYGYTPMFDIYPIQEGINSLASTIMSNQNAFGVQNVWLKRGGDISINNIAGGLNLIESDEPPQPLNLTQTPKEIFDYLEYLVKSSEMVSGINSVARGNPQPSLESGTALALVQSMALQFLSGLQKNYVKFVEEVGTSLINILKDFASTPRLIEIVGKNKRSYSKEFTGQDLSNINRVIVDIGNPLSRSVAGRVQMAEQLLQMKLLKNPEQYFQVMETGKLEQAYQGAMGDLLLIQRENEWLLEAKPVQAVATDKHSMHIDEHRSVINDPDLRDNLELVRNVQDHIQQHLDFLRNTDPGLLMLVGEEPLPPVQNMMPKTVQGGAKSQQPSPSNTKEMMGIEEGSVAPGENIIGPEGAQELPQLPEVDASLLPNPELQEQSLGNITT